MITLISILALLYLIGLGKCISEWLWIGTDYHSREAFIGIFLQWIFSPINIPLSIGRLLFEKLN